MLFPSLVLLHPASGGKAASVTSMWCGTVDLGGQHRVPRHGLFSFVGDLEAVGGEVLVHLGRVKGNDVAGAVRHGRDRGIHGGDILALVDGDWASQYKKHTGLDGRTY